jgi:(5-formylfuran-3-yl)methyl phosphate synthase
VKLLVSVVDVAEARAAAAAGADIVDVKNPAEGSLGAPSPAVVAGVRAAVPDELPVSAAIGDMPDLPGTAALAALGAASSGATFVKVGLWGVSTEDGAVALLRAVREGVAGVPGTIVVAAAYADAHRAPRVSPFGRIPAREPGPLGQCSPLAPQLLPRVARAAGVGVCLLDPLVKDGRGLLDWLSPGELAALVAEAHAAGLQVALAGALRADDLPVIRDAGADIAGVRSAACRDDRRSGPLDAARVRALRVACAATPRAPR